MVHHSQELRTNLSFELREVHSYQKASPAHRTSRRLAISGLFMLDLIICIISLNSAGNGRTSSHTFPAHCYSSHNQMQYIAILQFCKLPSVLLVGNNTTHLDLQFAPYSQTPTSVRLETASTLYQARAVACSDK